MSPVPEADVERGDGELVCERIEALCTVSKDGFGAKSGEPFRLRIHQRRLLGELFARRPDGRRNHREALIGLPRKNAKSGLGSALALDGLLFDCMGAEVYSAAAEKEQARIVFGETKRMVEAEPDLLEVCRPFKDYIEVPETNSIYRVLSAEAYSKEGLNISRAVIDELHAHPTDDLYDVLTLGSAARLDPLIISLTTAGVMRDTTGNDSICYRLYQYGVRLAKGEIADSSFYFAWWGAPDYYPDRLDENGNPVPIDYRDPDVWASANPMFGDLIDPEDLESRARKTPENEFKTKRLNMWVSSRSPFLPAGSWDARADSKRVVEEGSKVVLGFDGSRSGDSTGLLLVTVDDPPHFQVLGVWEKPEDSAPDWQVPRAEVLDLIRDTCRTYEVPAVKVDAYLWLTEMQDLVAEGIPIEAVTQTGSVMVPATQRLFEAVTGKRVTHGTGPLDKALDRHLENATLRRTTAGNQLAKEAKESPRKIDLAVCAVMALDARDLLAEEEGTPNIW